jgi:endonuclease/exonuclease/phosphatase family metal-dependent hydrolase
LRHLIHILLRAANLALALALGLSCLSAYVSPEQLWWLPFFGLAFAPLLVANIAFIGLWLFFRKWKDALLAFAVVLLCNSYTLTLVRLPFGKKEEVKTEQPQLKLLSYNVNMLGTKRDSTSHAKIADFVAREKFDLICLQEFGVRRGAQTEQQFAEKLARLPHRYVHYNVQRTSHNFGLATFSRYPIVGKGSISFANTANAATFTDIVFPFDTVRVYNLHFQSNRFSGRERDLLTDETFLLNNKTDKRRVLKGISGKLKTAFAQRARQVNEVAEHMRRSPYAVVVCGDFNDTPVSYTYRSIRGKLRDGFMEAGRGIMSTYVSVIPSFRIDYILYNARFCATAYYCPNVRYSDHYPLVCRLALRK